MTKNERWYYLEKARASLDAGTKARDPKIAATHLDLYERYRVLAAQPIDPEQTGAEDRRIITH